ncbi:hypothetical protein GCM10010415_43070 [Streptomyces atrovirens]|uniref:Uncharacterized protein n=1 Tax=Streptomyces atrovirens TaxID=285556 RepID=A0ABW0DTB8_9ACTN
MTNIDMPVPTIPGASTVKEAWAKLPGYIAAIGGYDLWSVEMLVRFDGAQRAGARIIERIEQRLAANNVGHLPGRLPRDGNCRVLLYSKDQPNVGFILRLVHQLATQEVNDDTNALVQQLKMMLDGNAAVQRAIGGVDSRLNNADQALGGE